MFSPDDKVSFQSSLSPGSYNLSGPSSVWSLSLEGREYNIDVSFVAEHSPDTFVLHTDKL